MNGQAIPGAYLFRFRRVSVCGYKWHPNETEMNRLCSLVEGECLNHFKNILKEKEVQSVLDRFLTSPLAKR
jgi:hypothetical protein